ncbi:hypothetical protein BT67DRAFT_454743 [Trichocladium antarcticum]|uniref:VLRF1 domain-containing protein n=1 Tax=Trichocladium antarcticum TaxID=1450529 RepID=A0AAN6UPZ8_9PEZI|nr:hypothetical protein BT67DRAFT_454743 [Trichocladium antarcticum]
MDKKQDEPRRPLYLYDLPPEVLASLSLKADAGLSTQTEDAADEPSPSAPSPDTTLGSQACSLCGLSFVAVEEQKEHLKTDLHHYNLKQKLNGLRPVSETEFEKLVNELDVSISGSDASESEDEEDETSRKDTTLSALLRKQASLADKRNGVDKDDEPKKKTRGAGNQPLLWFSSAKLPDNTYYGAYKAMFTAAELGAEDAILGAIKERQLPSISMPGPSKGSSAVSAAYKGRHIFLCMIGGGHFAAMVVALAPKQSKHGGVGPLNREAVVLAHKTFHRYTTRRKQGGSQSANDSAKGAAHSAGASIRRYNEQALVEDVRELLKDWKALIDTSDLLFIRATGSTNRRTLFGPYEDQVLRANDPRIRSFPFSTRRATQNELMRSFIELTRLKVKEIHPQAEPTTTTTTTDETSKPTPKPKPSPPKLTEDQETALFHTTQLQSLIRRSKLPALLSYLTTNALPPDFRFYPPDTQQNHHAPTPLHLAAAQNCAALVAGLLTRAGADPAVRSAEDKTAFELAGDRATRDAFRVARGELEEAGRQQQQRWDWDWDAARVPAGLGRAEAERRAERERVEREKGEGERRRREEERLLAEEGSAGVDGGGGAGKGRKKSGVLGGGPRKTAEERRVEEARGLTAEQKMRLERERRARAAEERIARLRGGG